MDNFKRTNLWINSLSDESPYNLQDKDSVLYLREVFLKSRERSIFFLNQISKDNPSLTIHNIDHVDCLWETASTICDDKINLNPLEAFIFGFCSLFHDMGLSLTTYDTNCEEIILSKEYQDAIIQLSTEAERGKIIDNKFNTASVPEEILEKAKELVIRHFHAFKARELPRKTWKVKGEDWAIIQDSDLRKFLGEKIGILSESHWWDIDKIKNEFHKKVHSAPPVSLPNNWRINNVKIACLLRLADYINLDYRRAPDLPFTFLELDSISKQHWTFQNKMNRPILIKDALVFESLEEFGINEIDAWWLAYNTLSSINWEIKQINDMLLEFNLDEFPCKRIKGIETPEELRNYIKTKDWEPVDTQLRISNVKYLIERFGGNKLYGDRPYIPIRELIQNSRDAIIAKEYYQPGFKGKALIKFKTIKEDEFLIVEDNGIGMSKVALINYLLDFGKSYWNSKTMISEYPGLNSSGFKSIGRFGIGFYSVFVIADQIKVVTKSIVNNSTWVLEFSSGLNNPPILRKALPNEIKSESGTTITLRLKGKDNLKQFSNNLPIASKVSLSLENSSRLPLVCCILAPALNINLYSQFEDEDEKIIISENDWITISNKELVLRLSGCSQNNKNWIVEDKQVENELKMIAYNLSPINLNGTIIARASIIPRENIYHDILRSKRHVVIQDELVKQEYSEFMDEFKNFYAGVLHVDGIWENSGFPISGIWKAQNSKLDRLDATLEINSDSISDWIETQAKLLITNKYLNIRRKLESISLLYYLKCENTDLPLVYDGEGFISVGEFYEICMKMDYVILKEYSVDMTPIEFRERVFCIPGNFDEKYYLGFKGQLIKALFLRSLNNLENSSSLDKDLIYRFAFLRKVIQIVCKAWGFKFGTSEMLDLMQQSFINFDKKLIDFDNIKLSLKREAKGQEKIQTRIKEKYGYTLFDCAILINTNKANRAKILNEFKNDGIRISVKS